MTVHTQNVGLLTLKLQERLQYSTLISLKWNRLIHAAWIIWKLDKVSYAGTLLSNKRPREIVNLTTFFFMHILWTYSDSTYNYLYYKDGPVENTVKYAYKLSQTYFNMLHHSKNVTEVVYVVCIYVTGRLHAFPINMTNNHEEIKKNVDL